MLIEEECTNTTNYLQFWSLLLVANKKATTKGQEENPQTKKLGQIVL